jgi:hypothetical protein
MQPSMGIWAVGLGRGSAGRFGSTRTGNAAPSSRRNRVDDAGRPRGRLMTQSFTCIFRNAYVQLGRLPLFPNSCIAPFWLSS